MLSFVVPAHNEEALIARTLKSIDQAAQTLFVSYEVVVADDSSADRTSEIAGEYGARVVAVNCRQISRARNAGAREARGDRFVFVDADTVITGAVLQAAIKAMDKGAVGGGCSVEFDGQVPGYATVLLPPLTALYRLLGLAAGCFLFCTRPAFEKVGGFDQRLFASEEIAMSRALKRQGRFVVLPESVTTSGRKLRTYTGREVLRMLGNLVLSGPAYLRRRDGLDLWYGERREDPDLSPIESSR